MRATASVVVWLGVLPTVVLFALICRVKKDFDTRFTFWAGVVAGVLLGMTLYSAGVR